MENTQETQYCECEVMQDAPILPTVIQQAKPQTIIHIDLSPVFWIILCLIVVSFFRDVIYTMYPSENESLGAARKKKARQGKATGY